MPKHAYTVVKVDQNTSNALLFFFYVFPIHLKFFNSKYFCSSFIISNWFSFVVIYIHSPPSAPSKILKSNVLEDCIKTLLSFETHSLTD